MAKGINKVILIGNLGADPEIRYLPNSGTPVATLRLATSEVWRDKQSGENQEKTEWHRVVLFNRLAEIANEYLRKGTKVFIEGKLRISKWQDSNGQDRYTTEIVANEMQMLDARGAGPSNNKTGADSFAMDDFAAAGSDFTPSYPRNNSGEERNGNKSRSTSAETSVDFNDDIPF